MSQSTTKLLILILICSFLATTSRINSADAAPIIHIKEDGTVEGTEFIQRSDNVYTFTANIPGQIQVERSDIIINGNGYTLSKPGDTPDSVGFTLYNVSKVTIVNTRVVNFTHGIVIGTLCSNNNITGNYLKDNTYSIQITDFSSHNFIRQNTIIGNTTTTTHTIGIECAADSPSNTISENTITDTYYGMTFDDSSGNNIILKNTLTNNDYGMRLYWSTSQNTISENNITNSYLGLYLDPAENNTIFNNKIMHSPPGGVGIYFQTGSNGNVIRGNTIATTSYGLLMINSSNNRISQNNFVNNGIHVQLPSFADFINSFDEGYPVGGNFWSNYTGVDFYKGTGQNMTGYDGIGDTPHTIDASNTDNYPLVGIFSSFDAYEGLRVEAVSNSTVNNFAYTNENGTIRMQVTNASSSQLTGFIRAIIPRELIREPYTVSIDAGLTPVLNLNDTLYDNATHRWIYFAYSHSTHEISVQGIPPDIIPVISVLSPEAKAYNKRDIPLTFTTNEPTSWIGFTLDGQSNVTTVGNTTLTNLSDAPHTIIVYANDTEGDMGRSATISFSVDTTPPAIEILSPQNTTHNARGLPLTFTLSEPTSWIGYSFDSSPNASIMGNTTITDLQNGSHTITIYANDTLGNMGQSNTVHFTIEITSDDTTPPIISITSPENKTYTTATNTIDIPLTFNVNEPTMWTAYSLDNKPNITVSGNTILTALTVGKHRIVIYALDTAGNAAASEEVQFSIEAQTQSQPFLPIWAIAVIIIVIALIAFAVYYFRVRKAKHR